MVVVAGTAVDAVAASSDPVNITVGAAVAVEDGVAHGGGVSGLASSLEGAFDLSVVEA